MKKFLIICLMLVCALVLTACGQEKQEQAQRNAAAIGNAAELHIFEGGDHSFTQYSEQAVALLIYFLFKRLKCGAC